MSEEMGGGAPAGAPAGAEAPGGGAPAGAAAISGGEGGGNGGGEPSWRDTLPDALKADPSLQNFADVSALAQGYIDTKKTATARVPDFKTDDGLKLFADAVRPAEATAYEIPVPDGEPSVLADNFRAFAHEIGMPPAWAKATAEFNNAQVAAARQAEEAASEKEVAELKSTMGADKYDAALEATRAMLPQLGVELAPDDLAKLDMKLGSANLLKFMFELSARVGDPAPIEGGGGAGVGNAMTPDQAQARWDVAQKDPDWRAKAQKDGTPESAEYKWLNMLIARGKAQRPKNPA